MKKKMILRYLIFLIGLFFTGTGIALTIKSEIGSTPMSIVPLVLSSVLPLSFGQMNFIWSLSFVFVQMLILGKEFTKKQYIQFLICLIFGLFIDLGLKIFEQLYPVSYLEKLIILFAGITILGLGIYLQVLAKVIINPGEGIVKAIAYKTKLKFGNVKIYFDLTVLLMGVILSLLLLHKIIGVREGTLIIAVVTGTVVKFFKWLFEHLEVDRLYEN